MAHAAVLTQAGQPLEIWDDVTVAPPQPGEVRVSIAATGVCHSDLSIVNGTSMTIGLPIVLGHEGAGVVEEVGAGVTKVRPGDHVVLSFKPICGECWFCERSEPHLCDSGGMNAMSGLQFDGTTRLTARGHEIRQLMMAGTFCSEIVVSALSVWKVPDDVPLTTAALLGCGAMTGFGAALNTASIRPGDNAVVIGCGGVGLNTIQGSRLAGAEQVIAIDVFDHKLELARQFGATHVINSKSDDAVDAVFDLTGQRGADHVFEVIGLRATIDQAITMTRQGGEAVLVGLPAFDVEFGANAPLFVFGGKTIKGSLYGSCDFGRDVARLLDHYRNGDILLDELISRELKLEQIGEAFDAMEHGEVARSVVVF